MTGHSLFTESHWPAAGGGHNIKKNHLTRKYCRCLVHVSNSPKLLLKMISSAGVRAVLGNFDGIHKGHRTLLEGLVLRAKRDGSSSVVVTFNPHPAEFFAKSSTFKKIDTPLIQQAILSDLGIDGLLQLPFDASLAAMSPGDFIEKILCSMPLKEIAVGKDFRFGQGRAGDGAMLSDIGMRRGFEVRIIEPVGVGHKVVSSSLIRHLLSDVGDVVTVSDFLNRPFLLQGLVVKGDQIGRQIGFPTANIGHISQVIPRAGVYSGRMRVRAAIGSNLRSEDWYPCVVNIGIRPTIADSDAKTRVEAHAYDIGATLNLYGEPVEIEFHKRLRDERRFDSLEMLKTQIKLDIDDAKRF